MRVPSRVNVVVLTILIFLISGCAAVFPRESREYPPYDSGDTFKEYSEKLSENEQKFLKKYPYEGSDLARIYNFHVDYVRKMIELSDGRIASSDMVGNVHIWHPDSVSDAPNIYTAHSLTVDDLIELQDGRIASAGWDGTVRIWNPDNIDITEATFRPIDDAFILAMALLPDGRIAVSFDRENNIRIWDPANPDATQPTYSGHTGPVGNILVLADGRILSRTSPLIEDPVHIWDPETLEANFIGKIDVGPHDLQIADGRVLSAGISNTLWDPATPEGVHQTFEPYKGIPWVQVITDRFVKLEAAMSITQLTDGRIVTGYLRGLGRKGRFYVWNTDNPDDFNMHETKGYVHSVLGLADGRLLVSENRKIHIWDPADL